jgi:hypothetical protein
MGKSRGRNGARHPLIHGWPGHAFPAFPKPTRRHNKHDGEDLWMDANPQVPRYNSHNNLFSSLKENWIGV